MTLNFWAGLGASSALLAIAHWFPWPRKPRRIEAYAIGLTALLIGQAVWLGTTGQWALWLHLALFCAVGGAVVSGGYAIDYVLNLRAQLKARDGRDE